MLHASQTCSVLLFFCTITAFRTSALCWDRTSGSPAFQSLPRVLTPALLRSRKGICGAASPIQMSQLQEGFPDTCCGPSSERKVPTWGLDLPGWADTALAAAMGAGVLLPAGIKVDETLQGGMDRIDGIANEQTADGVRMYVAKPKVTADSTAAVLLIHQFFGLRPRDTGLCDELAELGYLGIAPDCYGGATTSYVPRAISLVLPAVVEDSWQPHLDAVDAAVEWARGLPGVDKNRIYVAGFCFGGGVAARYSQWKPDKVAACGVFYGKPVSNGEGMPPLYAVFGAKDGQFPPAVVDEFEAELGKRGVCSEFRRYAGQGHAFVKDREAIKVGDAKNAWEGWLAFCSRHAKTEE